MKKLFLFLLSLLPFIAFAQDENNFGIKFSGYVKNDVFFDTRKVVSLREGHFLVYPEKKSLDVNNNDINAKQSLNILAIQSRLKGTLTGPDAFGAKTSGVIESEFFGHSDADINGLRLRHAYLKLNWEKTELLFGQTWNPMFITDCYPDVISINTGAPFQPFARNPQVRLTEKMGKISLVIAGVAQRDFTSTGPAGASSIYLRNSSFPDMHLHLQYRSKNDTTGNEFLLGIGGEFKILTPRLITDSSYQNIETVSSKAGMAYLRYKLKTITFKLEAVVGQNLYDYTMLGGYAIKYTKDSSKLNHDYRNYTPINNFSIWTDINTNGEKVQLGIFAAYSKNLGSLDNILNWDKSTSYFSRGFDIHHLYRLTPRIVFNSGKTRFATELEYTVAAYGTTVGSLGEVKNPKEVANLRIIFAAYYFF